MTILLSSFFILLLIGVPVAAVMGISSTLYLLARGADLLTIPQRMFAGADSFTLMAIPLYIFAGEIMNRCGITRRIFRFASEIVGFLPGGLALVMVPIFQPLAASFGFDPIHFGMVMVLTFIFGGITPPVGATLFIASSVGQISLAKLVKDMWPLILLFFIVMMLVAYIPQISTFLPALVA